jgi:predicted protein tyrosine phosphatase
MVDNSGDVNTAPPPDCTLPFELTICGVMEFARLDRRAITHAVSIWHPTESTGEWIDLVRSGLPHSAVHPVVFDDVEAAHDGFLAATPEQVRGVLEFAAELGAGHHLLVHCMAGVSRSTACAMAILTAHLGSGSERLAAATIRRLRQQARPNRLVVAHADALLERQGALVQACREVFVEPAEQVFVNKGWDNPDTDTPEP